MTEDSALLRRYADHGDEDAFAALVARRLELVYSVALRQVGGDVHLAHDVAQRVFSDLARQAPALYGRAVLSGWLYRAARFTAIDIVRAERRRRAREQEAQRMSELSHSPVSEADWQKLRPVLDDALSELPDRDRDAVMLRIFESLPFAEIGSALHLSEDAARMRVDRALEKLRHRLRRLGVTSTTAALTFALASQANAAAPGALAASVTSAALAAAKVGGVATAGGTLAFMSTSKLTLTLAGLGAAFFLGFGFYQFHRAAAIDATPATLATQLDGDRSVAATLFRRIAEAKPPTAVPASRTSQGIVSAQGPKITATQAFDADVERIKQTYEARRRLRASNPDYQKLWIQATRTSTRLDYASLYRSLAFTPEQIDRFETLVAEYGWLRLDVEATAEFLHLAGNDTAISEQKRRTEREFEVRLRALLGDDGYHAYQTHNDNASARGIISLFAGNLHNTASPLEPAQGTQLQALISAHNPDLHGDSPGRLDRVDWDAVSAQARTFLTPDQFSTWQALTTERKWNAEQIRVLNQRFYARRGSP